MMEKGHLRRLDRRLAYQGEIVDLYKDTVELPDGKTEEWDFVKHKKGCGACVVPILPDGRILLVSQYRPAVGKTMLELPAGGRDREGEPLEETARRELLEETGFTAQQFRFLCRIDTAVAWCNEYTEIYLAENIRKAASQHLDEAEEIRLQFFHPDELVSMIRSGRITDAKTVAGILCALTGRESG